MGRKIPGRKHRGVRDILEQNAKKEKSLENKVNAPPQDPDDQAIPKSLARIIELKQKFKASNLKNKKLNIKKEKETKSIIKKPLGKPEKVVPEFKRKLGESNKRFLSRVNSMVHEYLNAHKFEQKYKVDIIRDKSGEVLGLEKKPKDEIDELLKKSKKVKKGKKANEKDNIPKLTKSQKRREKLKAKKLKKQQDKDFLDFNSFKDEVKFGEVADAPPTLTKFPKNINKINANKNSTQADIKFKSSNTVKRKKLSAPVQKMLEEERNAAIEAYKNLQHRRK